nr:aldolase-type TIM barrel [Tanacetum cinerariifolium]
MMTSIDEAKSFVSPKWVPQLVDARDVIGLVKNLDTARLHVLVPNLKDFEAPVAAGAKEITIFRSCGWSKGNSC